MPAYKVPAEKDWAVPEGGEKRKKRQPTIHGIPISPEQMAELEVGKDAEVTLRGKVVGMSMSDDEDGKESTMRLAVNTTEAYSGKNEVEEVLDAGEED